MTPRFSSSLFFFRGSRRGISRSKHQHGLRYKYRGIHRGVFEGARERRYIASMENDGIFRRLSPAKFVRLTRVREFPGPEAAIFHRFKFHRRFSSPSDDLLPLHFRRAPYELPKSRAQHGPR